MRSKPHIFFFWGAWRCGLHGSIVGIGNTPAEAYSAYSKVKRIANA